MSKEQQEGYQVVPFQVMRRFAVDSGRLSRMRNYMIGLLEFDVTDARREIRAHKAATGEAVSFTAFIVHCLAKAVEKHRQVQAMPDWRERLVIFDDVNITVLIEVDTEQGKIPVPYLLRKANHKSVREISNEIRNCQEKPSGMKEAQFMRYFLRLPWFLRHLCYSMILKNPTRSRNIVCPVLLTAVGMFGEGGGWGIPAGNFSLAVTLGGIATKPGFVNGKLEAREYLCVTLSIDHQAVDGAPAARFAREFRILVEQSIGPEELSPSVVFDQVVD